jgi:hypothetical protein
LQIGTSHCAPQSKKDAGEAPALRRDRLTTVSFKSTADADYRRAVIDTTQSRCDNSVRVARLERTMRALTGILALGIILLPPLATNAARADAIDDSTQTTCKGDRCVGSYCNQDGDATNCWQESVYRRKQGEEVHWVCTKPDHRCKWIRGPLPDSDKWNVIRLETDQ